MPVEVVARDEELRLIDEFLAAPARPGVLLLDGAAGIGKTTLWEEAARRAAGRGARVLRARPIQSEAQLSYAAIGDLLEPVAERILPALAPPLRRALEVVLLLAAPQEGAEVSPRGVGLAVTAVVRALAEEQSLLLAVDDVQWLDAASAGALGFALRRLEDTPIHVLLAERSGETPAALGLDRSPVSDRLRRLTIAPLSLGALQRLLASRLGACPPRTEMRRLHQLSGGRPFHALELARAGTDGRVPDAIRDLLRIRLAALPPDTRDVLLHAALLGAPDVPTLTAALGEGAAAALEPAERAGLVSTIRERVAFTHPLYASALVLDATEARLRDGHMTLARAAQTAEERARHLALATPAPDAAVAERLEAATREALARGAPEAAATLSAEATRLTPADEDAARVRRMTLAGMTAFLAGESDRAIELLREAVAAAPTPHLRMKALARLARVLHHSHALSEADATYGAGLDVGAPDAALLAELHVGRAWVMLLQRRDIPRVAEAAAAAVRHAEEAGDAVDLADAMSALFQAELLLGGGYPEQRVAAALRARVDTVDLRTMRDPRFHQGLVLMAVDRLDEARTAYEAALDRAIAHGDDSALPYVLMRLSHVLFFAGDVPGARARAREGQALAAEFGQGPREAALACTLALCAAVTGDLEAVRHEGAEALARAEAMEDGIARRIGTWALGHAELLGSRPSEALAHLEPLQAESVAARIRDPGENRHLGDLLEALVAVGRLEEAETLARDLATQGERLRRPSATAIAARALALAASARSDHEAAIAHAGRAVALPVPLPLEAGRTRLVLGTVMRRARHRREARAVLDQAARELEAIGATGWAQRARAEAARIGGRPPASQELTPAERAVAELVASGKTNRETATALFVTDRTVETHLSRVYAKLNLRSRAELAARLRPTD